LRLPSPFRVERGAVAIFADAHLGQVAGDCDDFLVALSALPDAGVRTVVLLGDIFHYFIGDRKFETPLVTAVLTGLSRLGAAGLSFRYVEGNRDFFVAGTPYASPFAAYGDADGLEVGGKRYAFVHGDRVNTRDLPYRFWRGLSKNPVSRAVMRVLPGGLARSIVARTESRLYRTNFKHKSHLPVEDLVEEARKARQAGYDELLLGHFHVERLFASPDGVARILPAWLEERRHGVIAEDGSFSLVEEAGSAERAMPTRARPAFA
jgi:UDP-2,3-diacylglucosamine hydrolase